MYEETMQCAILCVTKVGSPITKQALKIGQHKIFKNRKAVNIESTSGQDSTSSRCSLTLCLIYSTYDLLCFIYVNP
jgi:hypothetical protein